MYRFLSIFMTCCIISFCLFSTEITKLNDELYTAEKDGIFYGFEKVVGDSEKQKWLEYINKQEAILPQLKGAVEDPGIYPSYNKEKVKKYTGAIEALYDPLIYMRELLDNVSVIPELDVWIAFGKISEIKNKFSLDEIGEIEIAVAVGTSADTPFETFMGVARGATNLNAYLQDKIEIHKNLLLPLFGFAAASIYNVYGDSKIFMINLPLDSVRKAVVDKFKDKERSVEADWGKIVTQAGSSLQSVYFEFIVKNWDGQKIFHIVNPWTLQWFLFTTSNNSIPYLVVDNKALRSIF